MTETSVTETEVGMPEASAPLTERPRTRWAAILWGLAFALIAAGGLWVALTPTGPAAFAEWLVDLTPLSLVAYAVLVVGGLLLVGGLAGLARRAQLRSAQQRSVRRDPR